MEPIKDTIGVFLKALKEKNKSASADDPGKLLGMAFTNREIRHLRFSSLKKGVLNIKVDSSAWMYYLNLKKKALLAKLAETSSRVKDIRFSIGDIK